MPARKKGIRLWLRRARRDKEGYRRRASWIILDGARHIPTGCAATEVAAAEEKLAAYIASRYQPSRKERDIELIDVEDVLAVYEADCGSRLAKRKQFDTRLERLNEFWGARKLSEVNGEACREYVRVRGSVGGARRDLEEDRKSVV